MINGLPQKLKTLRLKFGLSQKQVAERLGVSTSIVSGYETGERTPSTEILLSLSYLYQCSTDYLLGRGDKDMTPAISVDGLSETQIKALRMLIESIRGNKKHRPL